MKLPSFSRVTNNLMKMGYYPTDQRDAREIGTYLKGEYNYVILDPCCGSGEALSEIRLQISSYGETLGIEIEEGRAEKAKERFDLVINDDFFNLHVDPESFGAVFLNPPYFSQEQLHMPFIEKSTKLLAKGGVLILIIPDYELRGETARFLDSHYETIRIFKSNDQTFRQAVFFGRKREKLEISDGHLVEALSNKAVLITRDQGSIHSTDLKYTIPYTKELEDIKVLNKGIDPRKLEEKLEGFDEDWKKLIAIIPEASKIKRPLLPLRRGHLAQILASGMIDGVVEHPGTKERYLIKGTTTRTEEILEESEEETKVITRDVVTILMMDRKGVIEEIQ